MSRSMVTTTIKHTNCIKTVGDKESAEISPNIFLPVSAGVVCYTVA